MKQWEQKVAESIQCKIYSGSIPIWNYLFFVWLQLGLLFLFENLFWETKKLCFSKKKLCCRTLKFGND